MDQTASKKKVFDNRYEIISIVGRGAASVVYHARHLSGNLGDVALKVLVTPKGDKTNAELLRKEALAMVSARHKYVIRLDDFHTVGDLAYLSMEYAPLFDLRKYAATFGGKLGPIQGQLFLIQSAEALNFTHQAGIIHRDLKPDNLLVISDKEIRLGDFGVAVLPGEKSSIEDLQKGVGTMSYMAPEVLAGKGYDQRSDIYALGVCFYELLSGVQPFDKVPLAEQQKVRETGAFPGLEVLCPELPKHLISAISKAMRPDPEARFKTARDLVQAIILPKDEDAISLDTPSKGSDKSVAKTSVPESKNVETPKAAAAQPKPNLTAVPASASSPASKATPATKPREIKGLHQVPKKDPEEQSRKATMMMPQAKVQAMVKAAEEEPEPAAPAAPSAPRSTLKPARTVPTAPAAAATPPYQAQKRTLASLATIAIIAAVVWVLGPIVKSFGERVFARPAQVASNEGSSASPLPEYQGEELNFPALPYGMFAGKVSNVLPGVESPLTIISYPQDSKVVVLLGIEGWQPAFADVPDASGSDDSSPLRVKSNGFILDFTGQIVEGELMGYYRNVVSGEQGQWSLKPITKSN